MNKRLRKQRYVIIFIVCLLLTLALNFSQKFYYYHAYDAYELASVPYYLIEKNYVDNTELNFKSEIENGVWRYKEKIKNDLDLANRNVKYRRYVPGSHRQNKTKYLIFENTDKPRYCNLFDERVDHVGARRIYLHDCEYKNCEFTCDKNQLNSADAFVLYEDSASYRPEYFDMHKLNIFWKTMKKTSGLEVFDKYMFNWTVSHRMDSEVSDCLNGCVFATRDFVNIDESVAMKSHKHFIKSEFLKRTNQTVMIIDDICESKQRIQFAIELNQYFKTNFKGKCKSPLPNEKQLLQADYKQVRNLYEQQINSNPEPCADESLCQQSLFQKYKFLLSFETNNCTDDISNSFWIALKANIIPVVSYPTKRIYEILAPTNSFIHAEDFDFDMERLADHLHKVSQNYLLYLEYFTWQFYLLIADNREFTQVCKKSSIKLFINCNLNFQFFQKRTICELCHKLNTDNSVIYYEKLSKWFEGGCTTA
jgi:hypothetical protein